MAMDALQLAGISAALSVEAAGERKSGAEPVGATDDLRLAVTDL
jgi:hypothetical protein